MGRFISIIIIIAFLCPQAAPADILRPMASREKENQQAESDPESRAKDLLHIVDILDGYVRRSAWKIDTSIIDKLQAFREVMESHKQAELQALKLAPEGKTEGPEHIQLLKVRLAACDAFLKDIDELVNKVLEAASLQKIPDEGTRLIDSDDYKYFERNVAFIWRVRSALAKALKTAAQTEPETEPGTVPKLNPNPSLSQV